MSSTLGSTASMLNGRSNSEHERIYQGTTEDCIWKCGYCEANGILVPAARCHGPSFLRRFYGVRFFPRQADSMVSRFRSDEAKCRPQKKFDFSWVVGLLLLSFYLSCSVLFLMLCATVIRKTGDTCFFFIPPEIGVRLVFSQPVILFHTFVGQRLVKLWVFIVSPQQAGRALETHDTLPWHLISFSGLFFPAICFRGFDAAWQRIC